MTIFITGIAGFIGSHLAERLASQGHTVRGIDAYKDYYDPALKQMNASEIATAGIECTQADLANTELAPLLDGIDAIYHFAAQPGISAATPFDDYLRNNIVATHRLLEAARPLPTLKAFVNIATSSIYGRDASGTEDTEPRPASYYGMTKLAAEQEAMALYRDSGFPACSFRLFSVYGPRERPDKLYPQLMHSILADEPFPLFEGSESHIRSYTYVGDIVDGLVAALDRWDAVNGQIVNLGTPEAITTGEGIKIVEEILGRAATIERRPKRPGDQLKTEANIEKARRLLDYNPSTSPRQGLQITADWYREKIFKR